MTTPLHRSLRATCFVSLTLGLLATSVACSSTDDPGTDPGGSGGQGGGGSGGQGGQTDAPAPTLPEPTGTCPEFTEGRATFTVDGTARTVQLYVDPAAAATADGPVVFYWYGTAGNPEQAVSGLSADGIAKIKSLGGVVAAPVHANGGIFPWITTDKPELDYDLADEILACAKQKIGVDARHVHSVGFSAGALFTAKLSYARSTYLASVTTYSGGVVETPADPANPFAAMIINGGPNDMLVLNFQQTSQGYKDDLTKNGHFAFVCNHGGGHRIPSDAPASVVQFFLDHPYKVSPEPYATALPAGFPAYCTL